MSDTYSVNIAPQLRRHIAELDVIQSAGVLAFGGPGIEFHSSSGFLFDVRAETYRLAASIHEGNLVIERNGVKAATPIPKTRAMVNNFAAWNPTMISAFSRAPKQTGRLSAQQIGEMTVRVFSDTLVIPPTGLIAWARRQALTPRVTYETPTDAVNAIVTAIRGLDDKIKAQGMQHAFWDLRRDGNRVVSKAPKREIDIHPTLAGLLADVAIVRNIEVARERPTGAGELDFAFVAPLETGGSARVCAEFKTAHSDDLAHGVTHQLPAYMRSEGADFGVYGVLWFKGHDFDQPSRAAHPAAINAELDARVSDAGLQDVRVLVIDVAFPPPPSRQR